jgi:hypothetical protein
VFCGSYTEGASTIGEKYLRRSNMSETQEMREIEEKACYILELPLNARCCHNRVVNGDIRRYYWISDEEGERYVYTVDRDQRFNEQMKAAAKRHKKMDRSDGV